MLACMKARSPVSRDLARANSNFNERFSFAVETACRYRRRAMHRSECLALGIPARFSEARP